MSVRTELTNPFPGLRPFRSDEHHLFFGREDQTAALLQLLRENRFLAVVGTSGSGKSSLVRAGLIAALHRGTMTRAGSSWEVVILRPGGDPLANLVRALVAADLYDPDDPETAPRLRATLSRSRFGLIEAIKQSEDIAPNTNLLVVVDQFEELFRFRQQGVDSQEQAASFVNLLLAASEQNEQQIYVVLTMRSDYLGDCSEVPGLAEAVNRGEYLIPRLLRDQKRDAIEKPVGVGGAKIAPRLVQRMLNEVGDDPDQLPVLQHALMRTWDVWTMDGNNGQPIDFEHFEATGGMDAALSLHADEIYESLPDDQHRWVCERIFKTLTEKGSDNRGIRRPVKLRRLEAIAAADRETVVAVLDAFRRPGVTFLMPGLDTELSDEVVLDLSHESLMRVWRRLRGWVEEEAQSARIFRRLADTAGLWADGKAGLFRDPDLQIASSWRAQQQPNESWAAQYGGNFEEAIAFLDKSHEEATAEQRAKEAARRRELEQANALAATEQRRAQEQQRAAKRFKVLALAAGIIAVAALFAFVMAREARKAADANAQLALTNEEQARANAQLAAEKEQAATLATQEVKRLLVRNDFDYGSEVIEAGQAAEGLAYLSRSMRTDETYWPAGMRAMSSLASGRFRLREAAKIEQKNPISNYWVNPHEDLLLTSDQQTVAEGDRREMFVWDLRSGKRLYEVARGKAVWQQLWSPDGKRLYGRVDDVVTAWDARTGEEVWKLGVKENVTLMRIDDHPTAGTVVLARFPVGAQVFSAESGEALTPLISRPDAPFVSAIGFSPDARLFFARHSNGVVTVRETVGGAQLAEIAAPKADDDWYFSPDARAIVAVDRSGKEFNWWLLPRAGSDPAEASAVDDREDAATPEWIKSTQAVNVRFLPSGNKLAAIISNDRRLEIDVYDLVSRERTAQIRLSKVGVDGAPTRFVAWEYLLEKAPRERVLRFPLVAVIQETSPNRVVIWDLETGSKLQEIPTPWFLRNVEFAPDGRRVATVSVDGHVMLWDLFSRQPLLSKPLENEGTVRLAFSPDGEKLLTHDWQSRRVEFWDSRTGRRLFEPYELSFFDAAEFTSRGDQVALYSKVSTTSGANFEKQTEGSFHVVDVSLRPEFFELLVRPGGGSSLATYTPDGQKIVVYGRESSADPWSLMIFSADERKLVKSTVLPANLSARGLQLTPDGAYAVMACSDGRLRVWSVENATLVREIPVGTGLIGFSISGDGKRVATGMSSGKVRVWNLATGAPLTDELQHGTEPIYGVALNHDGSLVISGSRDFRYRLADATTGERRFEDFLLKNLAEDALFLPGETHVVLRNFDLNLPILDLASGEIAHNLRHAEPCRVALASPDGKILAAGTGSNPIVPVGEVVLWDWWQGTRVGRSLKHAGAVQYLSFSGDGSMLATGTASARGAVQVWDTASGRPLTDPIMGNGSVRSVSMHPSGESLLGAWSDGSVRLIDLPPRLKRQPPWLPRLTEAVARKQLSPGKHAVEPVPAAELDAVRAQISALSDGTAGARWARWFAANPEDRTISPASAVTLKEYLAQRRGSGDVRQLQETLQLAPADAVTHAQMALAMLKSQPEENSAGAAQLRHWRDIAAWYADRAVELQPEQSQVWALRSEVLEKLGRETEAREAIARAAQLQKSGSANVSYLQALALAREGKWEAADQALDEALKVVVESTKGDADTSMVPLVGILPRLRPSRSDTLYRNLRLQTLIAGTFEDFDATDEGQVPTGWKLDVMPGNPVAEPASLNNRFSESFRGWTVVSSDRASLWQSGSPGSRVLLYRPVQHVDGRVPQRLMRGRFLYARLTSRHDPVVLAVTTPEFDCSNRQDVCAVFHSAYEQDTHGLGAVEYTIDDGRTWLPALCLLDATQLAYDAQGQFDVAATFTKQHDSVPWYVDTDGAVQGRKYGDFIRAPIGPELAAVVEARRANSSTDSKRIEVVRLASADGQAKVQLRFILTGPGGRYWGIDGFGLYQIPAQEREQREEWVDSTADPGVLAGMGLASVQGRTPATGMAAVLQPSHFEQIVPPTADFGEAKWIWTTKQPEDGQEAFFRKTFDVQQEVKAARILAAGDDEIEVFLDGKRVLKTDAYDQFRFINVGEQLPQGRHVLAVRVRNEEKAAGLLLSLDIYAEDARRSIVTDETWLASSTGDGNWFGEEFDIQAWQQPHVLGKYGDSPFGWVFGKAEPSTEEQRLVASLLLRRARRIDSADPLIQLAASLDLAVQKRPDEALNMANASLDLEPLNRYSARVLSSLYLSQGDELKRQGQIAAATVCFELSFRLLELAGVQPNEGLQERMANTPLSAPNLLLLPRESDWKYLDEGPFPDDSWNSLDFDDSRWKQGQARLGYGDEQNTTIGFGGDTTDRRPTTHFRATVEVEHPDAIKQLILRFQRDDGIVIYINGQEVVRDGMPEGKITPEIFASDTRSGAGETEFKEETVSTRLRAGRNVIAAEIHQTNKTSSDLGFDLEVEAVQYDLANTLELAVLDQIEEDLKIRPLLRNHLWTARARRLRAVGQLPLAADFIAHAEQVYPNHPATLYEKALLLHAQGEETEKSAYQSYVQALNATLNLKNNQQSNLMFLPETLRQHVEPLGENHVALVIAARRVRDGSTLFHETEADWLLERCQELAGADAELRLALAEEVYRLKDYPRALELVDAALQALEPSADEPTKIRLQRNGWRLRERCLDKLDRSEEANSIRTKLLEPPPRPSGLSAKQIDLSKHFHASLYDGRWTDAKFEDSLQWLPETISPPKGIAFDLRGLVQLNSGIYGDNAQGAPVGKDLNAVAEKAYPDEVKGIAVGQQAQALHFLLSSVHGKAKKGEEVAYLVVHYQDESTERIPVRFAEDIDDWAVYDPEVEPSNVAWRTRAPINRHVRRLTWKNPTPEKAIASLDFISGKKNCAPFLIAISAE